MIKKATYFSLFFLVCFLTSFSVGTYQNFNSRYTKSTISSKQKISLSSKEDGSYAKTEFLFEENENETESDFEIQASILPFFLAYFQYKLIITHAVSTAPLASKLTNPIYIAVHNFRI